jgi:hypothetical protein
MKRLLVLIGLLLFVAGSAYGGPVTIHAVGFQPSGWKYGQGWQFGYPYQATINGGEITWMMCDDWVHDGFGPNSTTHSWSANITILSNPNLNLLRFGNLSDPTYSPLQLYDMAGWLILQTQVTPKNQWADINYAVWQIFDRTPPPNGPPSFGNSQAWLTQAQEEAGAGFPGVDFSRVEIFTPLNQYDPNPDSPQELMTIVPEPGTFIFLGSGLVSLVGRKLRA